MESEFASIDARFAKLWEISMQEISGVKKSLSEASEKSSANYNKIVMLALTALAGIVIELVHLIFNHG